MLLAVLAFCLPADGEILIYRKTMKCFEADGEVVIDSPDWTWDAGDERVTGYLILEVEYDENGEIIEINDAEQVEYWREPWSEGGDRWYEQFVEGFDVERIEIEDRWGRPIVYWVLEDWDTWEDGIWFVMHKGKARMVNIGLVGDQRRNERLPRCLKAVSRLGNGGWTKNQCRTSSTSRNGCAARRSDCTPRGRDWPICIGKRMRKRKEKALTTIRSILPWAAWTTMSLTASSRLGSNG